MAKALGWPDKPIGWSDVLGLVYPKEGTFWSDHPVGIVDREWVTPERREAAEIYIMMGTRSLGRGMALSICSPS